MNRFAVVLPYFGKLKPSFALWYESAGRNSDVDFFVFTDDNEPLNPASNVKWIKFTLQEFNALALNKLGVQFKITYPYKLCDFKPMYGAIFEDYLKGYEYWAYGDLDVIYGKITEYLYKIDYQKYAKINFAGHFCFIKNVSEFTNLFKASAVGSKDYRDVLESRNVAFDEIDMNVKARALNVKLYDGVFAADLVHEKGMQLVDGKNVRRIFRIKNSERLPKNYHYQIFMIENGRAVRYYRKFFKVQKDEFCYIHYRLELPINLRDDKTDTFLLSFNPKGFFDIDTANLTDLRNFMRIVKRYNCRKPVLIEKFTAAFNLVKRVFKREKIK